MGDEPKLVVVRGPALALAGGEPPDPPGPPGPPGSRGPRRSYLVMIRGRELGRRYAIEARETTLGRDEGSDIVVDDATVARHHVALIRDEHGVELRDLGTRGGTYVNDQRVERTRLAHGDMLGVGRSAFKVLDSDDPEQDYHEEIYRLSTTDALTQVFNKRYFEHSLEREVERARQHGLPLSIVMFDLDHFARCNDAHGHRVGDDVLRQVAALARERARKIDVVARFAGQAFTTILAGSSRQEAATHAEALRQAVADARFVIDGIEIPITVSVGVAALDDDVADARALVEHAQARVAAAKRRGRNVVDA